jgi:hypothetical protein
MGGGRWDFDNWTTYSAKTATMATDKIYSSRTIKSDLDPKGVLVRESRDSSDNPNSTPIIVGIDVTGSMGIIADNLAKDGLGTLFQEILDRKPVTDPHIMFMGIGDEKYDQYPLQVSQFEADNRIIEQLTGIYLEKGGGGNSTEGYHLPWYFAAQHTSIDSIEKRNKKGYLFTVGDEEAPTILNKQHISEFFGDEAVKDLSSKELLSMAEKMYNVFHVVVEQGSHASRYPDRVKDSWRELIGQRVIMLSDYTKLSEVIVSVIQVMEGESKATVTKSWSGGTSIVVGKAIDSLTTINSSKTNKVTRF